MATTHRVNTNLNLGAGERARIVYSISPVQGCINPFEGFKDLRPFLFDVFGRNSLITVEDVTTHLPTFKLCVDQVAIDIVALFDVVDLASVFPSPMQLQVPSNPNIGIFSMVHRHTVIADGGSLPLHASTFGDLPAGGAVEAVKDVVRDVGEAAGEVVGSTIGKTVESVAADLSGSTRFGVALAFIGLAAGAFWIVTNKLVPA